MMTYCMFLPQFSDVVNSYVNTSTLVNVIVNKCVPISPSLPCATACKEIPSGKYGMTAV